MATKVDSIPAAGQCNPQYHWDEWLDGSVWELTQGVDFDQAATIFRATAINKIKRAGLSLRVALRRDKVYIGPA